MRNLHLEHPFMTGPDVADWQTFLTAQGLLPPGSDGVFGSITQEATRQYQIKARLDVDGIVGPATLASAVRDGFTSASRSFLSGMDASVDCSTFAGRIQEEGLKFVARYYSRFTSKALSANESRALSGAGLQLVAVYQDANDSIQSFSAEEGALAAARALEFATAMAQPEGSAIYFAVDFDPTESEVRGPITAYFQAVHRAFAAAPVHYEIGVYGSGLACRILRDAGLARYCWLSASSGFTESRIFRPQAHLVQAAPDRDLFDGELNIDDDIAQAADFGAFRLAQAASAST